jgi:hypothetical protein
MNLCGKLLRIGSAVAATAVLVVCGVVHAQSDPTASAAPSVPGHHGGFGRGAMSDDAMRFLGFEAGLSGKTVTGAPFSATFSTQTTEVLADGNQIQRNSTGTFARDTEGRTRREMTLAAVGPWATSGRTAPHVVIINDTVAKTQFILEPDRKVARQSQFMRGGRNGQNVSPDGQVVPRAGSGRLGNRANAVTTSLGTQMINGVLAEGTRTTHTIPAGAIGNAKPMVITHERWYSSELQTVVMIKDSDPRTGVRTFELTNVQKQEPDATLFQVPSDYTLRQSGAGQFRRGAGQAAPVPSAQN